MTNFAQRLNEIATSVTSERSDYKYFSYKTGSFDEVTGSAPVYLIVSGNKYSLDGKWFNLPVAACNAIEAINPGKVREVLESNVVKGLTLNQSGIRRPMFIKSSGIWMEKNCPARAFVRCTRTLFHMCGIDLAEADIVFAEKNADVVFPGKKHVNVVHEDDQQSEAPLSELQVRLNDILTKYFKNGIRPHSFIDRNRFVRAYKEHFGIDLDNTCNLAVELPALGIMNDGKVLPRPSAENNEWLDLLLGIVQKGHCFIWFSRVMELHADEMIKSGVLSVEILRRMVARYASDRFDVTPNFCVSKECSQDLAQTVWGKIPAETVLFSVCELQESMPYVDPRELRDIIKRHPCVTKNGTDSYAFVERIELDDDEVRYAIAQVKDAVSHDGYFSLAQLDLKDSAALNEAELTMGTIRKVFFARYLANDYSLTSQIVTPRGKQIDGRLPLRLFCRERSDLMLTHADELAKDYNISAYLVVMTLHEEMVRVSREHFVSPSQVSFEVDLIDAALMNRCAHEVTPLRDINDFSDFPAVPGFIWNEYLLESFLRRASKQFRLLTVSAAPKDVSGVVVKHGSRLDNAVDAIALLAVQSDISADADEVGEFLIRSGGALRRRGNLVEQIVARMRNLIGVR